MIKLTKIKDTNWSMAEADDNSFDTFLSHNYCGWMTDLKAKVCDKCGEEAPKGPVAWVLLSNMGDM